MQQHDLQNVRTSVCPRAAACAGSPPHARPHAPARVSVHLSLRAPAVRWVVATMVTLAGQCTLVAHVEPAPGPAPAAAAAAAVQA